MTFTPDFAQVCFFAFFQFFLGGGGARIFAHIFMIFLISLVTGKHEYSVIPSTREAKKWLKSMTFEYRI